MILKILSSYVLYDMFWFISVSILINDYLHFLDCPLAEADPVPEELISTECKSVEY